MKAFWMFIVVPPFAIWFVKGMLGKNNHKKANQLYYPVAVLLTFLVCLVFVIWLGIYAAIHQKDYEVLSFLAVIAMVLLMILIRWSSWRITFSDEGWTYRREAYLYEEITKIIIDKKGCTLFVGKKKILIHPLLVNMDAFMKMLKTKKVFKNAEVIQKK